MKDVMRRTRGDRAWPLVAMAGLVAAAVSAQEPADRRGAVQEEALVERVVVDAHVTGPDGSAIPSLGPEDFLVKVDGKAVPLEAVDWLPAGTPEVDPRVISALGPSEAEATASADVPPGRVIVLFFETDHEISRLMGLLRMGIQARRFLSTLEPTDRVAVVSYDTHLKLRQDFTVRPREARARRARRDPPGRRGRARSGQPPVAVARISIPPSRARCATPERALELVARALRSIPGGKSMLFFGWGLGTVGGLSGPNASESEAWTDAMHRMAEARVNIFTLDVTDADYHSLEGSIQQIADLTGGHYEKTHLFPELALDRVKRRSQAATSSFSSSRRRRGASTRSRSPRRAQGTRLRPAVLRGLSARRPYRRRS